MIFLLSAAAFTALFGGEQLDTQSRVIAMARKFFDLTVFDIISKHFYDVAQRFTFGQWFQVETIENYLPHGN
jgi:hypothetical protein